MYEPVQMPDGRSLLLELPRELRDNIYDNVLEDSLKISSSLEDDSLIHSSGLVLASRQTHNEMQDALDEFHGPYNVLRANAHNFDFFHIKVFLQRHGELSSTKIQVALTFTKPKRMRWNGLGYWLGDVDSGLATNVSYSHIESKESVKVCEDYDNVWNKRAHRGRRSWEWKSRFGKVPSFGSASHGVRTEMDKIWSALQGAGKWESQMASLKIG